jgi:hypothetical protein
MKFLLLALFVSHLNAADIVVKHMPEGDQCIVCHQRSTPHQLLLRDGTKIDPTKVDLLCGQCHGIKHRRWLDGRHGKVVGSWKAESRKRLSCVVCHDPHVPKFPKFEAKAPPHVRGHH